MSDEILKCPNCLKTVSESESDHCEECGKAFCKECLIYYGELAFCPRCDKE
ncbi:MAG: hypothetical protein NY202_04010 [Mollicutes bacterium UO1]